MHFFNLFDQLDIKLMFFNSIYLPINIFYEFNELLIVLISKNI